jgi:hypothetical protein
MAITDQLEVTLYISAMAVIGLSCIYGALMVGV